MRRSGPGVWPWGPQGKPCLSASFPAGGRGSPHTVGSWLLLGSHGEVGVLLTTSDFLFLFCFVAEDTTAWAVTSVTALMLGETLREERTAADCGIAGAGGEAEVELPFVMLGKFLLASEGTRASGNL